MFATSLTVWIWLITSEDICTLTLLVVGKKTCHSVEKWQAGSRWGGLYFLTALPVSALPSTLFTAPVGKFGFGSGMGVLVPPVLGFGLGMDHLVSFESLKLVRAGRPKILQQFL